MEDLKQRDDRFGFVFYKNKSGGSLEDRLKARKMSKEAVSVIQVDYKG